MVEIILRKDIQDYEARPLFGFTYRQVATGAAIAIAAAGMGLAISSFTEINTMWLMLIMTVCAAIGLVVGAIVIMNIMLVTVTERTREIGIRKAIGADRGTILLQFLMEAVVLCMLGCVIGIFLSWCILRLASTIAADAGMQFALSGSVVALAAIFCFAIGVIFGLYPANKAAKMKPIDALHYGG